MFVWQWQCQQADANNMHMAALQAKGAGFSSQGRQSCAGNGLDRSAQDITWVMAEAVLAAVEQAATACLPVKRKKIAAEVVTGA